jgi:hypothetical protein
MAVLDFPERLHNLDRIRIIKLPRNVECPRHFLRNNARELTLFQQPIAIIGRTPDGQDYGYVNTVGAWLFGVNGYLGHLRITRLDDPTMVKLEWPSDSPSEVHELIRSLVNKVEA